MFRAFLFFFSFLVILVSVGLAQQPKTITVTISEPATVVLEKLFSQADLVAFIQIRSGDAENYNQALYKATVLKSYKGAKQNDIIYFTPFIGYAVGGEYLAFLKKTDKRIGDIISEDSKSKVLPYDAAQSFYRIMYEGYSIMPVSYECVFEKPSYQNCQYAVKFNIEQVILPNKLKVFPEENEESKSSDKKFVKRSAIESILEKSSANQK